MGSRNRFSVGRPCCGKPPPCAKCSADDDIVPVTLANWDDYACDCVWLNATFLLPRRAGNACKWQVMGIRECVGGGGYGMYMGLWWGIYAEVFDYLSGSALRKAWRVRVDIGSGSASYLGFIEFRWYNVDGLPFDCTATRILAYYSHAQIFPLCLPFDLSDVTCQVN